MALLDIIKDDVGLKENPKKKMLFQSLAAKFDEDLLINLELTSIELNDKYETENVSGWRQFLKYSPVRQYVNDFLDEISEKRARQTLSSNIGRASDAIKVKENIEANFKTDDYSNIVVWFLKGKDYGPSKD